MKTVVAFVARRHRVEPGIPDRRVDVLRFVGHQQQRRRLPARVGPLVGREEPRRGLPHFDDVAVAGAHLPHGQRRALQPIEHPVAGDVGLRGARRRRHDDRAAGDLVARQQPGDQLGQQSRLCPPAGEKTTANCRPSRPVMLSAMARAGPI